jgi:hypothetical protein
VEARDAVPRDVAAGADCGVLFHLVFSRVMSEPRQKRLKHALCRSCESRLLAAEIWKKIGRNKVENTDQLASFYASITS